MTRPAGGGCAQAIPLTDREYAWFTVFLRRRSGIELREGKQTLVTSRLEPRLRHHGLTAYGDYFRMLGGPDAAAETRIAVDLMTTNETYFFREPQHFEQLPELIAASAGAGRPVRVWSAASSTGEEAYSIALTLAECAKNRSWEVVGTDLCTRVLSTARRGLFPLESARSRIPEPLLRAHCLRGRGEYEGLLTLVPALRARVTFRRVNLTRPLPELGSFDVVFLRNLLIYFAADTKRQVVDRIAATLRPGGCLLIGHAETLTGLGSTLRAVRPSVYRLAGPGEERSR
jgi:chemotaxis protein methyltransferase CheR